MSGKVICALFSFLFIVSFKQFSPGVPSWTGILSAYNRADHFFTSTNSTAATDSTAMEGFREVIISLRAIPRSVRTDSLLFQSNYKLGILYEVYKDYKRATASYLQAHDYTKNPEEEFRAYVFAGAGYYNLNNFDSATYFLLRAEETPGNKKSSEDLMRLNNTLGVLYYDNGNYLQAKNYFIQAQRIIEKNNPEDKLSAYGIRLNIATCFYKLGMYQQALTIYRKARLNSLVTDPLYMNMGRAYAGLHQYDSALTSFKKVNITAVPGVLNEMARSAMEEGNADSALAWLNKYQNKKKSWHTNVLDDGVNELYNGEWQIFHKDPETALRHLQEALIIFSGNFSDKDIYKNPVSFTGSFACYRLFDVMTQKAKAWEMLYERTNRPEQLKAAYDTYQATISLLSYIERSYEMDDAKILLKRKSGDVYSNALTVCLGLNKLYPKQGYLESAFLISEKNKASVMSAQIRERKYLRSAAQGDTLATEERNIKFNIARLNAKEDDRVDTKTLQAIRDEKAGYETKLVILRRKMETNNRFYQFLYSDDFPSIKQLQTNMAGNQALISFYNTDKKIEVFVLTKSSLDHIELDSGIAIRQSIQTWIQILQTTGGGVHVNSSQLREALFEQLMKPILNLAGEKKEWVIVPDGLFFLLPFESLPEDREGGFILEKHSISYEFSARFIMEHNRQLPNLGKEKRVLAFAPFSQRGADLQAEGMGTLQKLPFSKNEIAGLSGLRFADQQATKESFLKNLNRFSIIHLATHAMTDLDNPSASYIAFYPVSDDRSQDFLFLDEIYSLKMDSCQMMVISACETGRGQLVYNEGVMSFARAFLYSGCPSTINTLWKADDHSTAEILRMFYIYLKEGNSKSVALQKAKLEFIRNNPVYRDPAYWSHIVITGDAGALYKKQRPWTWAVVAISCGTILFFTIRKRKKSRRFSQSILDV